jgi:hypothetical protein
MSEPGRRQFLSTLTTSVAGLGLAAQTPAEAREKRKAGRGAARQAEAGKQAPPAVSLGPGGIVTKFWIDQRLAALPARPWRKVHLDFHNSQHIPRIGLSFNVSRQSKKFRFLAK